MPDHLHALIKLSSHSRTINRLIAEGKRFRAYEIIKRLKKLKLFHLLENLEDAVNDVEKKKVLFIKRLKFHLIVRNVTRSNSSNKN